jgi:hypothetical protein
MDPLLGDVSDRSIAPPGRLYLWPAAVGRLRHSFFIAGLPHFYAR